MMSPGPPREEDGLVEPGPKITVDCLLFLSCHHSVPFTVTDVLTQAAAEFTHLPPLPPHLFLPSLGPRILELAGCALEPQCWHCPALGAGAGLFCASSG